MAGNSLKLLEWLEMAGDSWKWLEKAKFGWKWLELSGIDGNGWT